MRRKMPRANREDSITPTAATAETAAATRAMCARGLFAPIAAASVWAAT